MPYYPISSLIGFPDVLLSRAIPPDTLVFGSHIPPAYFPNPTSIVQNPALIVIAINQYDGTAHALENVLGATVTYGYDVGTASATVEVSEVPGFVGATISGTVTKIGGSATLLGVGTLFLSELTVGTVLSIPGGGVTETATVAEIISDDELRVVQAFVADASGQIARLFTTLSNFSQIIIYCDAGTPGRVWPPGTPTLENHPMRFNGLFLRTEATFDPHVFSLVCRGNLYRADQFRSAAFGEYPPFIRQLFVTGGAPLGRYLFDITVENTLVPGILGQPTGTDQAIVVGILQSVPDLVINSADIGGTGRVFGTVSAREMIWPPFRSALEMVQLFDQVCLGFRTFETMAGRIVRTQVFGYPSDTATAQFTEGVDIWEGRGTRSVEQLINTAYVEGATIPGAQAGLIYALIHAANPFQATPVLEQFASSFIEGVPFIEGDDNPNINPNAVSVVGGILNPVDVALWRLAERNRELVNIQFVTFRDDPFFPGYTITVNSPHMAVTEPVWLQRVELRVTTNPVLFQQTLYGVGGGLPGYPAGQASIPPPMY